MSPDEQAVVLWPPRKFQHRYVLHTVLFIATLVTTTFAGGLHYTSFLVSQGLPPPQSIDWASFLFQGLTYSVPVLLILGAHEFGHYFYCRKHDVDATLPYFLPAPIPLTGTFGGVIRIKERFPSKRALFDIGVAGPIAGFVVLVPFLYLGLTLSRVVRFPVGEDLIYFGEPMLLRALASLHFGSLPEGFDLVLHPIGFAAWLGMFATALNLLPFGQLDGGHLAYAVFGRHSRWISLGTLAGTVLLTIWSRSWISMAVIMLIMAFFLGIGHPQIEDEGLPLDGRRKLIALFALVMFVLCFTPVPIEFFFATPAEPGS